MDARLSETASRLIGLTLGRNNAQALFTMSVLGAVYVTSCFLIGFFDTSEAGRSSPLSPTDSMTAEIQNYDTVLSPVTSKAQFSNLLLPGWSKSANPFRSLVH